MSWLEEAISEVDRKMGKGLGQSKESTPADAEKCKEKISKLSPEELKAYIEINEEIAKRTSYGLRSELVKRDNSTVLMWSNSARQWIPAHPTSILGKEAKRAGVEIRLDANMIVVPYDYETVEKFSECLMPLPLYFLSTEAKARGEVDPLRATFLWAVKQYEKAREEEMKKKYK